MKWRKRVLLIEEIGVVSVTYPFFSWRYFQPLEKEKRWLSLCELSTFTVSCQLCIAAKDSLCCTDISLLSITSPHNLDVLHMRDGQCMYLPTGLANVEWVISSIFINFPRIHYVALENFSRYLLITFLLIECSCSCTVQRQNEYSGLHTIYPQSKSS